MKRIPKNGYNQHFKYKFASNEDVVDFVRPLLAAEHVTFLPSIDDVQINGKHVMCRMTMRFVDGETDESFELPWYGQAVDTGDKGISKCATAATKYFLLKTFLLSAGDESEIDTDNHADEHSETVKSKKPAALSQMRELKAAVEKSGKSWDEFSGFLQESCRQDVDKLSTSEARYWIDRINKKLSSVEDLKSEVTGDSDAEPE